MPNERYTFEQARARLEEIAAEVRKKDTSLERSLDLLEEGVRLANTCTELVDHTGMGAPGSPTAPDADAGTSAVGTVAGDDQTASAVEGAAAGERAGEDDGTAAPEQEA
jgi:exodeoxyribonuclease VII small subunit